jgi:hypothetical protein
MQITRLILSSCLLAALAGCGPALIAGGAAVGAGTVMMAQGEVYSEFARPMDDVWKASLAVLKDLDLQIWDKDKRPSRGLIKARRLDGSPITIRLSPETRRTTKVAIRVGTFGDEDTSKLILDEIAGRLHKQSMN